MNKIKFITKLFVISVSFVLCSIEVIIANTSSSAATATSRARISVSDQVLEQRIQSMKSFVDLKITPEVKKHVKEYTYNYPYGSEVILGRVNRYFPLIEDKIREKNLPDELKYLCIIESALKPNARSRVGATGMWQFMRATARMYGLKMNNMVDERKDPYQSTEAALNYLSDLYEKFNDWTLALAAYNCGPGNVAKAIRRANSRDSWEIRPYLPRETRDYLPRFIAASYLMHYYHMHNLQPRHPNEELKYTSSAKIYEGISFKEISNKTGVSLSTIKVLNPAYIRNFIPENEGRYFLTLPQSEMNELVNFDLELSLVDETYNELNYKEIFDQLEQYNKSKKIEEAREMELIELIPTIQIHQLVKSKSGDQNNSDLKTASVNTAYIRKALKKYSSNLQTLLDQYFEPFPELDLTENKIYIE